MIQENQANGPKRSILHSTGVAYFWDTLRRVREEDRTVSEADEGFVARMLSAAYVLKRIAPLYLLLAVSVLLVQLIFFDNLEKTIVIYGGTKDSKTGKAAEELARALSEDYNREVATYRWWKSFRAEGKDPKATPTSAARLGKLVKEPTSLLIIQDGYRPNFEDLWRRRQPGITEELSKVHTVDVRAIADLWDSYLHVFVSADASGKPRIADIGKIDPKSAIFIGQGAQAALSRKILCKYGVFPSDEGAKAALDKAPDPADPTQELQPKTMAEAIDAVRAGQVAVAFILTSSADIQKYFEANQGVQGNLQLLPIDRAEAIAEEITFGEVAQLPWYAYQYREEGAEGGKSKTLPVRFDGDGSKDSAGAKGIKTLKTQTILACSSVLTDGVVLGILNSLYSRTSFKEFSLHPRPPADQKFLFPMHNASHTFHKGGPAQSYITSPFIVGGLTLILGQLLYISAQLRERKSHLRDRESRRREESSQRFIEKLKHLLKEMKEDPASSAETPEPPGIDRDLYETYEQAVHDFGSGRINREGFDRIVELHRLSRRRLGRKESGSV